MLTVLLVVVAYVIGWHAGNDSFMFMLRNEYPAVLDMLRDEMDRDWRDDDENQ